MVFVLGETARRKVPLLAALLLAAAWGCGRPQEAPPPAFTPSPGAPVVLISIDTLRSDRLPVYGYQGVETPAIDALAADAILFERAYAHYPLTLPSHVSLFTGQLPTETGVRDNAGYRLPPDYPTYLPHLLRASGYATGAAVSSYAIRAATGLAQGFDVYDDAVDQETGGWGLERDGPRTLAAAVEWLDTVARPFFLFFHLYEPHLPLTPPEPFRTRYGETYEAEVAAADAVVGQLLAELRQRGLYDGSLIVLLSDHGEGLKDHGEEGHGIFLYREAIQVPLLVKLPGAQHAAASVAAPVGLVDVAPTILEVLGLPLPHDVRGASLLRALGGTGPARALYAETLYPRLHYGWSDLASLIDGRFHYIEAPEPELYDLEADPAEEHNVLRENRRVYAELRDRLAELRAPFAPPAEEDEETRKRLAALGYLASTRQPVAGPLPDPKVALPRHSDELKRAFELFHQGEAAAAIPAFEGILEQNPQATDVWRHLGMALRDVDRPAEALAAFEQAMQLSAGSPQVAAQMGQALVDLGRLEEARAHADIARPREPLLTAELDIAIALAAGDVDAALRHAAVTDGHGTVSRATRRRLGLELSDRGRHREAIALLARLADESDDVAALNALAQALLAAGRIDEAEPLVERVLERAPTSALALERRGLIALERGRPAAAREALERSLESNDKQANSWNLLGVALFQLRDVAGALAAWERAVELDSRQWDSLYNLGFTAARAGQRDRARAALRRYVDTAPPGRFRREIAEARRLLRQLGG